MKQSEDTWRRNASQSGAAGAPPFPDEVKYPKCCGAFCRSTSSHVQVDLASRLKSHWTALVVSAAAPKKVVGVSATHCCIAVQGGDDLRFYRVACAHARWGRWEPSQVYMELQVVSGDPRVGMENVRLRLSRCDYHEPYKTLPRPLCAASVGMFQSCTEDELSAACALDVFLRRVVLCDFCANKRPVHEGTNITALPTPPRPPPPSSITSAMIVIVVTTTSPQCYPQQ